MLIKTILITRTSVFTAKQLNQTKPSIACSARNALRSLTIIVPTSTTALAIRTINTSYSSSSQYSSTSSSQVSPSCSSYSKYLSLTLITKDLV
jgi:hypothetical protein